MEAIIMWCQLITANGHETVKVEAYLTNQLVCENIGCTKAVRIRQEGDKEFRSMPMNMCFFSKPNQENI